MRPQTIHLLVLCALVVLTYAWTKEDHEIFRLRDEVESVEGQDVTFYDFLGVKPSASNDDIQKAFRRKSKQLHPDKVKHSFIASRSTGKPKPRKAGEKGGVHVSKGPSQREIQTFNKKASERYSRLGVVANVLKGESRERYDHFLKNGFPAWKGTGYYYTRFRPGLGSVVTGLFVIGGGFAHYGLLVLSWRRQRDFVDRYIRQARKSAWGDETGICGIPGIDGSATVPTPAQTEATDSPAQLNRRQKREMERQNKKDAKSGKTTKATVSTEPAVATPEGQKKRVVAENGKILIVDSIGNVFLEETDEDGNAEEFFLDANEAHRPTWRDTAVYRLPAWLYGKVAEPFLKRTQLVQSHPSEEVDSVSNGLEVTVQQLRDSSRETTEDFEMVEAVSPEDMGHGRKRGKKGKK